MRVVHIIKAKGIAGAEGHLLDLLAGLRQQGIDAQFVLLAEPNHTADSLQQAAEARGIPVNRVLLYRHLDFGVIARLRDVLRALHPDLVHTHLIHADLYGILAARWVKVPAIFTSRHNDDPRRRRLPMRIINGLLWRMVTRGIAISEAVRRFSIEVEGAPAKKIHTVYYGLPLPVDKIEKASARRDLRAEIGAVPDAPVVGMVCRLMDAKGLPDAIDAFAQLTADFPDARFVIAGEGALRPKLEAQIRRLALAERVQLLGWRAPMPVIAALDVLLMPSVREGFGLTLLEAMSQAIPIIGSTASAIPEVIVHGETGLTVPPRDPDALAAALRVLLNDKPLRMHMGLLGEERLETHFSAAQMIEQTLVLYREALSR